MRRNNMNDENENWGSKPVNAEAALLLCFVFGLDKIEKACQKEIPEIPQDDDPDGNVW